MIFQKRFKVVLGGISLAIFLFHPNRFSAWDYSMVSEENIESSLLKTNLLWRDSSLKKKPLCPPLDFRALSEFQPSHFLEEPNWKSLNESQIAQRLNVQSGGSWAPRDCTSPHESVIIVPYRDRESHLNTFLKYVHPFLQAQNMSYRILVIEQAPGKPFNRGKIFNVGFLESSNPQEFLQCAIFHDVDLIPLDARNIYGCSDQPRHMSSHVDTMRFNLPYDELFGGVISVPTSIFKEVNGFSNRFFGWGGEDDDLRIHRLGHKFPITRFPPQISKYKMLSHVPAVPNPNRFNVFNEDVSIEEDGLSTTTYEVIQYKKSHLYTKLIVDV